ncbi:MAG: selenocysteine-specific translation elongation factor [Fretibacterium sp.]|nr:selenocysteine-specific translation elongation factor [Fretibacterium sp.]
MARNAEGREVSLVIGTAGHIDHGKTTLISALTGVDCDRLIEEKRRGITIELGFAPLRLEDGRVVSVIDVPGHERFIRQMVAGASGIDATLLVVAADESVMPQTREHLAIMELLGVKEGLVAVTKIDRVEEGMAGLVVEDVAEFVRGTFLEGKPIVPVSGVTGDGLDALRREIAALVDRVKPRPRSGALFLPIDRAFPIAGFGTVITGTAYHGVAHLGDEIEVLPCLAGKGPSARSGREGRIRSLQVHGQPVEDAYAGQRVAANLSGIAVDELSRGDVVCHKGVYAPTSCFDAVLKLLPATKEALRHWQRLHLCIGTSEVLARVALLRSKQIAPGGEEPAQLVLEEPVVCTSGQRFILRFYSPLITIGGGTVVYPYSHKPRGAQARARVLARIEGLRTADTPALRLERLVGDAGMLDAAAASIAIQETPAHLTQAAGELLKQGKLVELKGDRALYFSPTRFEDLMKDLLGAVAAYQKSFPAEAGLPLDEALRQVPLPDAKALRSLAAMMVERGTLVLDENKLHTPDFVSKNEGEFLKNSQALAGICRRHGWQLATLDEVRAEAGLPPKVFNALIQSMKNSRGLVILENNYVLTSEMEQAMLSIFRGLGESVTLAAVRDATQSSRKFILPILEYFDSKGYTRRAGDVRIVK